MFTTFNSRTPFVSRLDSPAAVSQDYQNRLSRWVKEGGSDMGRERVQKELLDSRQRMLILSDQSEVSTLPPLPPHVEELRLKNFPVCEIPADTLTHLDGLMIENCPITHFAISAKNDRLLRLDFSQCTALETIALQDCSELSRLTVNDCPHFLSITDPPKMATQGFDKLREVNFNGCPNLRDVPEYFLYGYPREIVKIRGCTSLVARFEYSDLHTNFYACAEKPPVKRLKPFQGTLALEVLRAAIAGYGKNLLDENGLPINLDLLPEREFLPPSELIEYYEGLAGSSDEESKEEDFSSRERAGAGNYVVQEEANENQVIHTAENSDDEPVGRAENSAEPFTASLQSAIANNAMLGRVNMEQNSKKNEFAYRIKETLQFIGDLQALDQDVHCCMVSGVPIGIMQMTYLAPCDSDEGGDQVRDQGRDQGHPHIALLVTHPGSQGVGANLLEYAVNEYYRQHKEAGKREEKFYLIVDAEFSAIPIYRHWGFVRDTNVTENIDDPNYPTYWMVLRPQQSNVWEKTPVGEFKLKQQTQESQLATRSETVQTQTTISTKRQRTPSIGEENNPHRARID